MNYSINKSYTKLENYTVLQIVDGIKHIENKHSSSIKIRVPKLQRNLVWNDHQKTTFIDTLKKGYPFGSLLFYKKEENDVMLLVDGLQRTSTMLDCFENPLKYFDQSDIKEEYIELFQFTYPSIEKELLIKEIVEWLKKRKGFNAADDYDSYSLIENIEIIFEAKVSSQENRKNLKSSLNIMLDEIKATSDISNVVIPVVIYNGEESNLPEIFERVNSKGTKLNKYQIFAATWEKSIKVENREILEMISLRYKAWEDEGFIIDNYDEDFLKQDIVNVTLFEYLFGLGKYLQQQYPILFGEYNEDKADEVDSSVFNLVTACNLLDIKDMSRLEDKIITKEIEMFETSLFESIKFVYEALKPILTFRPYKKDKNKEKLFHSEFFIVSLISTVFHLKFNLDLSVRSNWKDYEKKLSKSIPSQYLYDILRDSWRSTGDRQVSELVLDFVRKGELDDLHYLKVPTKDQWKGILYFWFNEQLARKEKKRVNIDQQTKLFIKYLYYKIISFGAAHDDYHIDHIFPIQRLRDGAEKIGGLPISCVANLTLLSKENNLEKTKKTFPELYEFIKKNNKSPKENIDLKIEIDKWLFDDSNKYLIPTEKSKDKITSKWFENVLRSHFEKMVENLFKNNNLF
ncbi:DUF262 domain-containing protein [Rossellomorea sp. GAMAL-10_SWC]